MSHRVGQAFLIAGGILGLVAGIFALVDRSVPLGLMALMALVSAAVIFGLSLRRRPDQHK